MASGWAALICVEIKGDYPPHYKIGGLFFAVWGIYLFDRIYDSMRFPLIEETPRRHAFAKKRRPLLLVLSGIALVIAGVFILPHVTADLIRAALFPGILCLLYFVTFRFVKRRRDTPFPSKELVIGFCFASGVMVAAGARFSAPAGLLIEGALAALFAGNCLIIGRAEHEFDRKLDGASFFGKNEGGNWIPVALFACSIFFAVNLGALHSLPLVGGALATGSLLQFACRKWVETDLMQPLADGALLLPWVAVLFFG